MASFNELMERALPSEDLMILIIRKAKKASNPISGKLIFRSDLGYCTVLIDESYGKNPYMIFTEEDVLVAECSDLVEVIVKILEKWW